MEITNWIKVNEPIKATTEVVCMTGVTAPSGEEKGKVVIKYYSPEDHATIFVNMSLQQAEYMLAMLEQEIINLKACEA